VFISVKLNFSIEMALNIVPKKKQKKKSTIIKYGNTFTVIVFCLPILPLPKNKY